MAEKKLCVKISTIKKKGGIFIKKLYIFLILFSLLIMIPVKAEEKTFYEAEYIDGIYMNKYQYSTHTIFYQKARFFRKTGTDEFAYCIEPFRFFDENSIYESTASPNNLTKEQIDHIVKIAHFGFGYIGHTDPKWYAITQMMIWQEADQTGEYYFTDSLNGNRIDPYSKEMREIHSLIDNYSILPSFSNQSFDIVSGHSLTLKDENHILNQFTTTDGVIQNNQYEIKGLKAGNYTFSFIRKDTIYNKPFLFFQSLNSQNLLEAGDIPDVEIRVNVSVIDTYLELNKIDSDTKSTTPSGEASLDGAIYSLYDEKNHKIQDLIIKDNQALVKNLDFGNYFVKEEKAGIGYTLDNKKYSFTISKEKPKVSLVLENQVIKKDIILEKLFGEENSLKGETGVSFYIKNKKGTILSTVTTNQEGIIHFSLPYGTYQLIQVNSTDGYQKIDPITVTVLDSLEEKMQCIDWKISVPDTHIEEENFFTIFLRLLWIFLY